MCYHYVKNCHFVNIKISTTDIVIGQIQILKKLKRCYLIRLPKERLDWKWYVCHIEYEKLDKKTKSEAVYDFCF